MKSHVGHTGLEQRSAEECRAVADAHARTLKDFWKRFAVSGLFVIAVVIIIFASLAWFASNNGVDASTATISAKAARFSIDGYSGDETAGVGYYERSDSTEKPTSLQSNDSMKVSATFNLNNYDGGSLRPGSSGELQITVTPVTKNLDDIKISLERIVEMRSAAKAASEAANSSSNDTSATSSASIYAEKTIPEEDELEALFRGHIVFFRSYANGYYSDPVLDDTLTIDASQFVGAGSTETTQPVAITLYWVWPSQFSSFVLTGQINYNPNLFAKPDSTTDQTSEGYTGYSSLLAAINDSKSAAVTSSAQYYRSDSWGTTGVSKLPDVSSGMSAADLQTCAAYYNYADEALGSCAAYLQVRFTAEEVSQTS